MDRSSSKTRRRRTDRQLGDAARGTVDAYRRLARLSHTVSASLAVDEVLEAVVRAAVDLVAAASARIWVVTGARAALKAEAGTLGPHGAGRKTVLSLDEGLTGHVARTREVLRVDDVLADARTVNVDWIRREGLVSYVGLPLVVSDRLMGVLGVYVRRRHRFSPEELELLTSFGTHAAIAINNARVFEESEARRRAAESLARSAHALTETLDVSTVAARTVDAVHRLLAVRYVVLRGLRPDGTLVALAAAGDARPHFPPGHVVPPGTELVGRAVAESRAVWSADLSSETDSVADDLTGRIVRAGIRGFCVTPLVVRGRTTGVLAVGYGSPHAFAEEELTLLGTFADQAALALENAQLYEAATEALDFLRSIAANSADAIVTTDVRGLITFASARTEELLGQPSEALRGRPLADFARLGHERFRTLVRTLVSGGRIRDFETVIHGADGRSTDVNVSLSLLRNDAGTITGSVGVIRDIGDRVRAERERAAQVAEIARLGHEAQAREAFIRDVMESLGEGLVVFDAGARIIAWNRAMAEIWRVPAEGVLGRCCGDVFGDLGPPFCDGVAGLLAGTLSELRLEGIERRRGDERAVVLDVTGNRLGPPTEPSGVALLIENVTDKVALQRAARQAEKLAALGTLSAGTAHEINNPIGIITGRIDLMLRDAESHGLPDALRADLRVLQRNAARVTRIVQRLLAFSRSACGDMARVDLARVVVDTLALVEQPLAAHRVRIVLETAPDLPAVFGDANALAQVVLNLVTNAIEAMAAGGEIRVDLGTAPGDLGRVRLTVADTGSGIAPHDLARVFEPFYTTKSQGTGLGLAVSYGIVREHRGVIDVESEVGRGTTFTVTLPAAHAVGCRRPS
jgi:two-component system nitrogen regulation sensor histidine kinase GlnL